MTPADQSGAERVIGTPKGELPRYLRLAIICILCLSAVVLVMGVEAFRLGMPRVLAIIPITAAIPMIVLCLAGLVRSPQSTLVLTLEELVERWPSRRRRMVELKEVREVLVWNAPPRHWRDLRIPEEKRNSAEWVLILTKNYDELPESTQRDLRRSPFVFNRQVHRILSSMFRESALSIGSEIAEAAAAANGRPVLLRELTETGPEEIRAERFSATPAAIAAGAVDSSTRVVSPGTLCIECGYDLRGRSIDDLCPECGAWVGRSRKGHLLSAADPRWLARIQRGAVLLCPTGPVLSIAAVGLFANGGKGGAPVHVGVAVGLAAVMVVMYGLFVAAGMLLTTREPSITGLATDPRLRRIARTFMGVPLAFAVMGISLVSLRATIIGCIGGALIAVGVMLMYAARLLYRVPLRGWAASSYAAGGMMAWFSGVGTLPVFMLFLGRVAPALAIGPPVPATGPAPVSRSSILPVVFAFITSILALFLLINLAGASYKLYAATRDILRSHETGRNSKPS